MNWHKLSKFASGYGSWLTPSGNTIDVSNMGHEQKAWEILQSEHGFQEYPDNVWGEMFDLGYIRLNYRPFTVTYSANSILTSSQKRAIAGMIRESDGARYDFFNLTTQDINTCRDYLCAIELVREM
jgi:hypothetical protein